MFLIFPCIWPCGVMEIASLPGVIQGLVVTVRQFETSSGVCSRFKHLLRFWQMDLSLPGVVHTMAVTVRQFEISSGIDPALLDAPAPLDAPASLSRLVEDAAVDDPYLMIEEVTQVPSEAAVGVAGCESINFWLVVLGQGCFINQCIGGWRDEEIDQKGGKIAWNVMGFVPSPSTFPESWDLQFCFVTSIFFLRSINDSYAHADEKITGCQSGEMQRFCCPAVSNELSCYAWKGTWRKSSLAQKLKASSGTK